MTAERYATLFDFFAFLDKRSAELLTTFRSAEVAVAILLLPLCLCHFDFWPRFYDFLRSAELCASADNRCLPTKQSSIFLYVIYSGRL